MACLEFWLRVLGPKELFDLVHGLASWTEHTLHFAHLLGGAVVLDDVNREVLYLFALPTHPAARCRLMPRMLWCLHFADFRFSFEIILIVFCKLL